MLSNIFILRLPLALGLFPFIIYWIDFDESDQLCMTKYSKLLLKHSDIEPFLLDLGTSDLLSCYPTSSF